MNSDFDCLKKAVIQRRTVKPSSMNGKKISQKDIEDLIELANWAPTHGHTEPWRFFLFSDQKAKEFGKKHAELYRSVTDAEKFDQAKYEKLLHNSDKVSHVIVAAMKRGINPKIPEIEELCSAAASVENVLLGASAMGIAAMWNTGGMTHTSEMKNWFGLEERDRVIGIIYLGYSDEIARTGKRIIALSDKVRWM